MTGFHRSMGREYDLVADFLKIGITLFPQEFKRYEARMPLVEMEGFDIPVPEVAEDPEAAYPEYQLLAEPVPVVAAVEFVCQRPVFRRVFRKVGIKEEDWYRVSRISDYRVRPYSDLYLPVVHHDADSVREGSEQFGRIPVHRPLRLSSLLVYLLCKIAFLVKECYAHHRHPKVCPALKDVSGKYSKPSRICRDLRRETYLH